MKKLTCEICGSEDFVKQEGVFVCQSCGAKYSVEEAKKMMSEGATEAAGKVTIDNSKLDNLYKVARSAREDADTEQAFKLYEQIRLEDPDNWEPIFFIAYFSAINILKNDKQGDSVKVVGGSVSLGGNYRSGIIPAINSIGNCLNRVFSIIEKTQEYNEQKSSINIVSSYVESFSTSMKKIIENESERMFNEIKKWENNVEKGFLKSISMVKKNNNQENQMKEMVSDLLALVQKRKKEIDDLIQKRRIDEFWAANQPLKAELESEKTLLAEQIANLNREISSIPTKTEGYDEMVKLQTEVENLNSKKKTFGLFKIKEKKTVQAQIDSTNNKIAPIQARIDSAINEVKKQISTTENKIKAIDMELTKPR
jgi:transcription elongation factor Elf1